jgi:hypothetical protein
VTNHQEIGQEVMNQDSQEATMPDPIDHPLWRAMYAAYDNSTAPSGRVEDWCDHHGYAAEIRAVADEYVLRFRDEWDATHAATERWLLQQALIAEGRENSEEFALLRALDHPEWRPVDRAEAGE